MKTLLRFEFYDIDDPCRAENFYTELEGNYDHLDGIIINYSAETAKCVDLQNLIFTESGKLKVKALDKPTKDWDHYITAGILCE